MTSSHPQPRDAAIRQTAPATAHPGPGWQTRFWLIYGGQSLSLIGSALTQFVLLWWITETTGSLSALATAGMAALLPQALLSPIGGLLADRWSRRALMVIADAVSAACMGLLILLFATDSAQPGHIHLMLAVRSAMQALQAPAAAASVAMLVPATFLSRAAGLSMAAQSMTVVAAAPLGALALATLPIEWALALDVLTALAGIAPLLFIRVPQPRDPQADDEAGLRGGWRAFTGGAAVIWGHPGLRGLYALLAITTMTVVPSFTLVPLLVKQHFGGGVNEVALIEGLSGIGMLVGSLLVAVMAPRRQVLWVLSGFAASCLSIAITALVPPSLFGVAVFWWFVSGLTFVLGEAPLTALLQGLIPAHLQGRVLSLLQALMGLAAPVGMALVVPLGEQVSIDTLFIGMGVASAAICLAGLLFKDIRRLQA